MKLPVFLALLAALAALPTAQAQPIYRCGNEYTRIPCPGGHALEMSDPRSAAQRAEAQRLLVEEEKRGKAMERERRHEESAIKPAAATSLGPAAAASAPAKSSKKTTKKSGSKKSPDTPKDPADRPPDFVAAAPPQPKASATKASASKASAPKAASAAAK
jgi:hypothetical protein